MAHPATAAAAGGELVPPNASAKTAPSAAAVAVPRLPGTPDLTSDGFYRFSGGGLELVVNPRTGSVVRLSLDGNNALISADEPAASSARVEGSTLVVQGSQESKRFRLDTARRVVEITYTLVPAGPNGSVRDLHRVPSQGGLTFFPAAPNLASGSTLKLNVRQPVVWFSHDQAREPKTLQASVQSTEGWVATVNDGSILIKVFSDAQSPTLDITSAYDPETKQRPWVELAESTSVDSPPDGPRSRTVRLFLRKLPPNIAVKPGNQELVGFVRGIIQ